MQRCIVLVCFLSLSATLVGCKRDFRTEEDLLRARIVELERNVAALERRNAALAGRLARLRERPRDVPDETVAATPEVVEVSVGRLSHGRDTSGDGQPDTLVVYVRPADDRGRFVQLVGELRIHAALLPPDRDAVTIARMSLTPTQVRDAYRSGFTGTHYTINVPIQWPEDFEVDPLELPGVTVRVIYIDGHTGLEHAADRVIGWRR